MVLSFCLWTSPHPSAGHITSLNSPPSILVCKRTSDHATQTFKDSSLCIFHMCNPEPLNSVLLFLITPSLLFCGDREVTSANMLVSFTNRSQIQSRAMAIGQ